MLGHQEGVILVRGVCIFNLTCVLGIEDHSDTTTVIAVKNDFLMLCSGLFLNSSLNPDVSLTFKPSIGFYNMIPYPRDPYTHYF